MSSHCKVRVAVIDEHAAKYLLPPELRPFAINLQVCVYSDQQDQSDSVDMIDLMDKIYHAALEAGQEMAWDHKYRGLVKARGAGNTCRAPLPRAVSKQARSA